SEQFLAQFYRVAAGFLAELHQFAGGTVVAHDTIKGHDALKRRLGRLVGRRLVRSVQDELERGAHVRFAERVAHQGRLCFACVQDTEQHHGYTQAVDTRHRVCPLCEQALLKTFWSLPHMRRLIQHSLGLGLLTALAGLLLLTSEPAGTAADLATDKLPSVEKLTQKGYTE